VKKLEFVEKKLNWNALIIITMNRDVGNKPCLI
jgi:hypothetical protein